MDTLVKAGKLKQEMGEYILNLFERYVDEGLKFVYKKCTQAIAHVPLAKVQTLCCLLEVLLTYKVSKHFPSNNNCLLRITSSYIALLFYRELHL